MSASDDKLKKASVAEDELGPLIIDEWVGDTPYYRPRGVVDRRAEAPKRKDFSSFWNSPYWSATVH